MSSKESVFVDTYDLGVQRVLNTKNYALLIESTMAEYRISQNCKNLTQIGGLLNSRGYGIGTQQGNLSKTTLRIGSVLTFAPSEKYPYPSGYTHDHRGP